MMKNNSIIVIAAILGISAIVFFCVTTLEIEKLGSVGDFFGGVLNPTFAFLSLIAILTTIKLQSDELDQTREELRRSAKAQENSERIFKKQQFESTFFSILNQINIFINKFTEDSINKENHHAFKDRNMIIIEWWTVTRHDPFSKNMKIYTKPSSITQDDYFDKYIRKISPYESSIKRISILIHELLKLIETEENFLDSPDRYAMIIKSCLNDELIQVLAVYWIGNNIEFIKKNKKLIEKYSLLENMPFRLLNDEYPNPLLGNLLSRYDLSAFGESNHLKELRKLEEKIKN